jgi:trans-aconitate methyltransferase
MRCNICQTLLDSPIYSSRSGKALTSLCQSIAGQTRVWSCGHCGHIMTEQLFDAQRYYAQDYKILLSHDEEDQIYDIKADGQIVYRSQHQLNTLLAKLNLPQAARMLDYGCAKAAMPKLILEHRADLKVHLFDVSEMYLSHWQRLLSPDRWAINTTPDQWQKSFDVITSYFALEHIDDPVTSMRKVADLLKPNGVFYGIVPDVIGNVADFIVIDHVNHFTEASLHYALSAAGFRDIEIDQDAHRGALVFIARLQDKNQSAASSVQQALEQAHELANYWIALDQTISRTQEKFAGLPFVIYGSGFYGSYIASMLNQAGNLLCFLDASPYQQGKTVAGMPVLAPDHIPAETQLLYVGLNPAIARKVMNEASWLKGRSIQLVFLDGELHA